MLLLSNAGNAAHFLTLYASYNFHTKFSLFRVTRRNFRERFVEYGNYFHLKQFWKDEHKCREHEQIKLQSENDYCASELTLINPNLGTINKIIRYFSL